MTALKNVNHCAAASSYKRGSVAMVEKSDREELERRFEQAKRMVVQSGDAVTKERLEKLVQDLEGQLRKSE
jgi:hypothetical protein